jgi:hypothetical protein
MTDLSAPETPATEAPTEAHLTIEQAAALAAAVELIACQITGAGRNDAAEGFRRLGMTPAEAGAIASIGQS